MNINLKATNMELTQAIRDYAERKVNSLEKFIKDEQNTTQAWVEVGKINRHHQSGDIFRAEINLKLPLGSLRSVVEKNNLYAAIDDAREEMKREIRKLKTKHLVKERRGARILKKLASVFYK